MTKNYAIDFTTRTLTINKDFAEALNDPTSNETRILSQYMTMFPDLRVVRRSHKPSKKTREDKGLTYDKMRKYISLHENAEDLLKMFALVVELAKTQNNSFLYTKTWFLAQFPKFYDQPEFVNGKLKPAIAVLPPKGQEESQNGTQEEKIA